MTVFANSVHTSLRLSARSCATGHAHREAGTVRLTLKVVAVAIVGLMGGAMAVDSLIEQAAPDPQTHVVAGDPGWAHVTGER